MKARVLLADDHTRFPEILEASLWMPEFEVVGPGRERPSVDRQRPCDKTGHSSSPSISIAILDELRPRHVEESLAGVSHWFLRFTATPIWNKASPRGL